MKMSNTTYEEIMWSIPPFLAITKEKKRKKKKILYSDEMMRKWEEIGMLWSKYLEIKKEKIKSNEK
jgi:hypothetical protein